MRWCRPPMSPATGTSRRRSRARGTSCAERRPRALTSCDRAGC
jgi:hypothetical protein